MKYDGTAALFASCPPIVVAAFFRKKAIGALFVGNYWEESKLEWGIYSFLQSMAIPRLLASSEFGAGYDRRVSKRARFEKQ